MVLNFFRQTATNVSQLSSNFFRETPQLPPSAEANVPQIAAGPLRESTDHFWRDNGKAIAIVSDQYRATNSAMPVSTAKRRATSLHSLWEPSISTVTQQQLAATFFKESQATVMIACDQHVTPPLVAGDEPKITATAPYSARGRSKVSTKRKWALTVAPTTTMALPSTATSLRALSESFVSTATQRIQAFHCSEIATRIHKVLELDESPWALKPGSPKVLQRLTSTAAALVRTGINDRTLNKDLLHREQYWVPFCTELNTPLWREDPAVATILLIMRWASEKSLNLYVRPTPQQFTDYLDAAHQVSTTSAKLAANKRLVVDDERFYEDLPQIAMLLDPADPTRALLRQALQ